MMHYSQEIRSPFLEKNFVEYAMSIPVQYRYINKRMKPLLRMAFDKEIPENILWREKVCEGDGVGIEYMVKNQKQNIIDHYKKVYK
jgi:asparagine synthase (glutamine-hydrolysing)